jgi:hypothetical protein
LYECETWSLILTEEHRLKVFENRVLRKISGPKREEVTGEWRRLHNEELYDFYSSPNTIRVMKSRKMRWAGYVARNVERGEAYRVFFGGGGGGLRKRDHFGNLGVDVRTILKWIFKKWDGGMDRIDSAQDTDRWRALVNAVKDFRFPENAGNLLTS